MAKRVVRGSGGGGGGRPRGRGFARGERVAVILGAGATKACHGPLTTEILPRAFEATGGRGLGELDRWLMEVFAVPGRAGKGSGKAAGPGARAASDYPQLPMILSLLDTAIDRAHDLGPNWPTARLRHVRHQAEYAVLEAIAYSMRERKSWDNRCHEEMLRHVLSATGRWPVVVSFNYDLRIDYAMMAVAREREGGSGGTAGLAPDYGCDFRTPWYRRAMARRNEAADASDWARLFKVHGSMHWLYCPACHGLEVGMDERGRLSKTARSVARALAQQPPGSEKRATRPRDLDCGECGTALRPVLITPTSLKDYRNPHISGLWYRAERALRECDRAVFVGYSLPWDDVDVIYLLKRGLWGLGGEKITVVEHGDGSRREVLEHEAGRRYQAVFGRGIDWQPVGFVEWVKSLGR